MKQREQELLDIVNSKVTPFNNNLNLETGLRYHSEQFIKDFNIKASPTEKTPCYLIYWKYLKWCKFKKIKKPLSRKRFFDGWKKIFRPYKAYVEQAVTENGYYIERQQFNISMEEMEVLWQYKEVEDKALKNRLKKKRKNIEKRKQKSQRLQEMVSILVNTQE